MRLRGFVSLDCSSNYSVNSLLELVLEAEELALVIVDAELLLAVEVTIEVDRVDTVDWVALEEMDGREVEAVGSADVLAAAVDAALLATPPISWKTNGNIRATH